MMTLWNSKILNWRAAMGVGKMDYRIEDQEVSRMEITTYFHISGLPLILMLICNRFVVWLK